MSYLKNDALKRTLMGLMFLISSFVLCSETKPNVLFIAVDDLNDWVTHLKGHPQVQTPNIDRLASRGVSFTNAYCAAPLCNSSRISLLTGISPVTSEIYGNGEKLRTYLPDTVTLMQHFMDHGYQVKGGGKIFHGNKAYDKESWHDYFESTKKTPQKVLTKAPKGAWAPWGAIDADDEDLRDTQMVSWSIEQLKNVQEEPFFLACGFTKPHLPWKVPKKYFDQYPIEKIALPKTLKDDLNDIPGFGMKLAREVFDPYNKKNYATEGGDHNNVLKHKQWKNAVQAYLATISYVDTQIGRLLDALDQSGKANNTIILLWGDHGWHLGEKQHWRKHALWERSTKTPLIIADPQNCTQNKLCKRIVSLLDIYPTLIDLCHLKPNTALEGRSLKTLLDDPNRIWNHPVITTYGKGNHAIRTEHYRLIQYHDGGLELYDHTKDPHEWTNLAFSPEYKSIIQSLKQYLPKT